MKLEHVIGKDGLHRLRLTGGNGEKFDNSQEGFDEESGALRNLRLKLCAYLVLGGLPQVYAENIANTAVNNLYRDGYPTVDERAEEKQVLADMENTLRNSRNGPSSPSGPSGPVEPQLR